MSKIITSTIYTVDVSDDVLNFNCVSNSINIYLFPVKLNIGKEIYIKKTDSSSNTITINSNGNEKIENTSSYTINFQNEYVKIVASNDGWFIIDTNVTGLYNVLDITAGGTVNAITGTYSNLTYQTNLKIRLATSSTNTGAVTFNLNGLGAKNVYVKKMDGTKTALTGGELPPYADIQYDGTDFILLNSLGSESSTTATVTQEITTLPVYAKGILDSTLRGNTYVNIALNGNFTSTTAWSGINGTISASSNELTFTVTSLVATSRIEQPPQAIYSYPISTYKYYCSGYIYPKYSNSTYFTFGGTQSASILPAVNVWNKITGVITATNDTRLMFYHNTATNYALSDTIKFKEVMVINLTEMFGAGNEPTQAQADLMFANWFDGVKSTDRQIVKSVGKNLFDGTIVGLSGEVEATQLSNSSFTIKSISFGAIGSHNLLPNIKWKNNTQYRFSGIIFEDNDTKNTRLTIWYTDNTSSSLPSPTTTPTPFSFTSLANKTIKFINYIYSSSKGTTTYQNFQIEQGSTATTYEPYTETTAYSIPELKSISSTIKDTYNANTGKHTKNISDWVDLTGSLTWEFSSDYAGYKTFYALQSNNSSVLQNIKFFSEPLVVKYNNKKLSYEAGTSAITNGDICRIDNNSYINSVYDTDTGWDEAWVSGTSFTGMTWANLIKAYMNGWKLTTVNTNVASCVWTGIASGTSQSGSGGYSHVIANIDTGYTPYRIIYQLATPVIKNYYPSVLNANPSGTVYVYPAITDYDFYNNGAFITNTLYLIDTLEYVNKVDKVTGALTPIALSTCTINANKLSFTSTALSSGDLVDYGYTYKDLTTVPDLAYTYSTNLQSQVNSNSNQISLMDNKIETLTELEKTRINIAPVTIGSVSATTSFISFIAPYNCTLRKFKIATKDAITASDTDYWTIELINKGASGSGTDVIATKTTKTTGGQAFASYDMWDIGTLNSTYKILSEGDVVVLALTKTGSATAFAEARGSVEFTPL